MSQNYAPILEAFGPMSQNNESYGDPGGCCGCFSLIVVLVIFLLPGGIVIGPLAGVALMIAAKWILSSMRK